MSHNHEVAPATVLEESNIHKSKEAWIRFLVWILVRYDGMIIPKKLGYEYDEIYFLLYIFIYYYAYNF